MNQQNEKFDKEIDTIKNEKSWRKNQWPGRLDIWNYPQEQEEKRSLGTQWKKPNIHIMRIPQGEEKKQCLKQ